MAKKSKSKKPAPDSREDILVSLQEEPKHLEELGSRVVAARLTQVADEHVALAKEDVSTLAPFGFDVKWQAGMAHAIAALKSASTDPDHVLPTSPELEAAIAAGDKWISTYLTVIKNSGPAVRKAAPKVSHNDHSPRVLANQLDKLSNIMSKLAKQTARHGGGQAFADLGQSLSQTLAKARAEHSIERGAVPVVVQDTHAAAGLVYAELVRLSRAAHNQLAPARAKLYGVTSLRAARHHHAEPETPAAPAPPKKSPGT